MNIKKIVRTGGVGAALFVLGQSAQAALPTGVASAISTAQADGVELGGLFLAMAVAVGVLFWLKRKAG